MIKNITFTNINTEKKFKLNFNSETNIIVGPKGGGKSTIFNLIAGLPQNYISNKTISALESFDLEFIQAEMTSGEIKNFNNLEIKKLKKNDLDHNEERYDIISQNDPIKTQLDNHSDIEKDFHNSIKEVIEKNKSVANFKSNIQDYHTQTKAFKNLLDTSSINWGNTFKMNEFKASDFTILYKDQFNSSIVESELKTSLELLESKIKDYNTFSSKLTNYNISIKKNIGKHISLEYQKEFENATNNIQDKLLDLKNLTINEIANINKKILLIKSFSIAYKNMINKIKHENKAQDFLSQFKESANKWFKEIAHQTIKLQNTFNNLTHYDYNFKFDSQPIKSKDGLLTFKVEENITITKTDILEFLKTVFHTPTALNSFYAWLTRIAEKGVKEFKDHLLFTKITKLIKENNHAYILANDRAYNTLSLGEKSIFGINHKLLKNKLDNMYLDQVEDNLDNKTIVNSLIPKINEKNGQKFIVTHNANVGILTNVKNVIIADKDSKDSNPYSKGIIVQDQNSIDSDLSIFLEGGTDKIVQRLHIIKGEKYEN